MMKHKVCWIIGKLFSLFYLLTAILFLVAVWRTQMVPGLHFGLLTVVAVAIAALVIWLTWSGTRKGAVRNRHLYCLCCFRCFLP